MALRKELEDEVAKVFRLKWSERDGNVVPEAEDLTLGNDAVKLDATVLYADLADSTDLVDDYKQWFAAYIYKTFLHCAAKIIRSEGGVITAYDGDMIMAVYIGKSNNTRAVRSAMKIKWAVDEIVNPLRLRQYPKNSYDVSHVIGIDTSNLFVARTGVRGANDLVWVGRAANYAAKLSALPDDYATYITEEVFHSMNASVTKSSSGEDMWTATEWDTFDGGTIYRSNWRWKIS
jgi:class 3 adenylate cyclase